MKYKILVIEDNEQNLYLATFILEKYGYEVFQARNGLAGIESAKMISPHLILLDIQLPLMDGYAIAKELKKQLGKKNTPIIAVTSYAMPGDREKAMESGFTDYLTKPIDPETFIDRVKQYLPDE